jgi:hypothetical protein
VHLPRIPASYGASMGRPDIDKLDAPDAIGRVTLRRIRLDRGGYDSGGAYWGHGQPLYYAGSNCGRLDIFFRAANRIDAKAKVTARYPAARFYS